MDEARASIGSTRDVSRARRRPLAAVVLASSLLAGCGDRGTGDPRALATVDGVALSEEAFRHHWTTRSQGADTPEVRRAVLDGLIERKVLAQRAREAGLADDPEVVAQIENLLARRLREVELNPRVAAVGVTDDEIASHYEANRAAEFSVSPRDRVAVLWFRTRGQAPLAERYRPRLERARAAVVEDPEAHPVEAGFGSLAIECSEHSASRYRGGDLGWIERERLTGGSGLVAAVAGIAGRLDRVGEVSAVTEVPGGLVVVRLVDREAGGVRPLEEVRERIERALISEKRRALEEAFVADTIAAATVAIDIDRLDALRDLGPSGRAPEPDLGPTPRAPSPAAALPTLATDHSN